MITKALTIFIASAFFITVFFVLYNLFFQKWYLNKTQGLKYFSLTQKHKSTFTKFLKLHQTFLLPFFSFIAKGTTKTFPGKKVEGYYFPAFLCNQDTVSTAAHMELSEHDVVVATQMKSGTTLLTQIVTTIANSGKEYLKANNLEHIYQVTPWIETGDNTSISYKKAPRIGDKKARIIKTHLPFDLCPFSDKAKYIYLHRDPVSCFQSTKNFLSSLMGPFAPEEDAFLEWFCSDKMFWGHWPNHVTGWKEASQANKNILFLSFEELTNSPFNAIKRISNFLDMELDDKKLEEVVRLSSHLYMRKNIEQFEMASPNIFSVRGKNTMINTDSTQRYQDASKLENERILSFCKTALSEEVYKELVADR